MILWISVAYGWDASDGWEYQAAPVEEKFELNTSSFAEVGPADDVEAVFLRALTTWNQESGADLYVEYGGRTSNEDQGYDDDHNVSAYGSTSFSGGLAVATTSYDGGNLSDCDISFRRQNLYGTIDWHLGQSAAPEDSFDLANTMTHEMGHCLGMGHSDDEDAIMYGYNVSGTGEEARHLSNDDRAGMQYLYGAVDPELIFENAEFTNVSRNGDTVDAVVVITLRNTGDGSAYAVEASIDGSGAEGTSVDVGNIGSPTPVGERVGADVVEFSFPWTGDCGAGDAAFDVELTDARGNEWNLEAMVPVSCEDTIDGPKTDAKGCGCDSRGGGAGAWVVGLAAVLGLRRKRG